MAHTTNCMTFMEDQCFFTWSGLAVTCLLIIIEKRFILLVSYSLPLGWRSLNCNAVQVKGGGQWHLYRLLNILWLAFLYIYSFSSTRFFIIKMENSRQSDLCFNTLIVPDRLSDVLSNSSEEGLYCKTISDFYQILAESWWGCECLCKICSSFVHFWPVTHNFDVFIWLVREVRCFPLLKVNISGN